MDSSLGKGRVWEYRHFYIYSPRRQLQDAPPWTSFPSSPSTISTSAITHCRQVARSVPLSSPLNRFGEGQAIFTKKTSMREMGAGEGPGSKAAGNFLNLQES